MIDHRTRVPVTPQFPQVASRDRGRGGSTRRKRRDIRSPDQALYPQGLAASFWFESGEGNSPYTATIRFTGRRVGATGRLGRGDAFTQDEFIERIIPGSGSVSITARVNDINPGEWAVTAETLNSSASARASRPTTRLGARGRQRLPAAAWSWRRWRLQTGPSDPVKTRWAALTNFERMPAVIPGSWTGLVLLGVVLGLFVQAVLVRAAHLDVVSVLAVAIVASLAGIGGAKAWYVALNAPNWRGALGVGLCIQGFLVGAVAVGLGGLLLFHLPIGPVLDATAPALFFGIAVGRLGCFFTGCCAGRPSHSRWAVWSSDRRVGARRIPTQLLESSLALGIGGAALLAVLRSPTAVPGAIFLAAFAAYTLGRQGLLRLRTEGRRSSLGGLITAAAAALVLVASATGIFLAAPA